MNPRTLVRLEGALVGAGATALYVLQGRSLLLFLALILAPDISMAGYLHSTRVGAASYNVVHTYLAPGLLAVIGVVAAMEIAVGAALVWTAHIGADRLFGFGLKYADREFGDTHIQQL
ncbi:DUF4260 domain-containing protein [Haloarcula sp. S1AR25-5A]|uniref:DUF4260 domain-containing protein n=1 Tax=Haloarcula terrestris TaxID=2950533 RepID=A0AAE4EU53_9EURY|nr:DUF4260 domain-containing protein [Haloarcula terrestris]MDS0220148.1 DUF4260 domain-containing protein [Haloarcula terrestris]